MSHRPFLSFSGYISLQLPRLPGNRLTRMRSCVISLCCVLHIPAERRELTFFVMNSRSPGSLGTNVYNGQKLATNILFWVTDSSGHSFSCRCTYTDLIPLTATQLLFKVGQWFVCSTQWFLSIASLTGCRQYRVQHETYTINIITAHRDTRGHSDVLSLSIYLRGPDCLNNFTFTRPNTEINPHRTKRTPPVRRFKKTTTYKCRFRSWTLLSYLLLHGRIECNPIVYSSRD